VTVSNWAGSVTSDSAQLSATKYYVAFNCNGGSTVDTQHVICNYYATEPVSPEKSGYKFAGWYLDAQYNTVYIFSTMKVTSDIVLYAKWTAAYTVIYDGNGNTGGSVPVDANSYTNKTAVTVLGNTGKLTKTNYAFSSWNTEADGSGTSYTPGSTFEMGAANVTLYAQWVRTYKLTFNSQSSETAAKPDTMIVVTGKTVDSLPTAPIKTGCTFAGWWTEILGSGDSFTTSKAITADDTLYARWIIKDYDGNVYNTITIGTQTWTVENLRTTKYNDGTSITLDTSTAKWASDTAGKYCYYNNTNNADSINKFGALYNWYAVNTGNLAPAGWHVPTTTEWDTLENFLIANGYNYDSTTSVNKIAKSMAAKTDWMTSTETGAVGNDLTKNNKSGFSALPSGYRYNDGYCCLSTYAIFWCSSKTSGNFEYPRFLYYYSLNTGKYGGEKSMGFSVRLLRD
jgi:uncharacterized protein (TIGR02145 family)/uncharacterized repeat protein (TIGR02543 family)